MRTTIILVVAALACTLCGCATAPSSPPVLAGTAVDSASDAAVVAARRCLASGCSRAEALDAAERAAVGSLIASGVSAIDAQGRYRPYINAALLLIELSLTKSPTPNAVIDLESVRAAVAKGIADAEAAR